MHAKLVLSYHLISTMNLCYFDRVNVKIDIRGEEQCFQEDMLWNTRRGAILAGRYAVEYLRLAEEEERLRDVYTKLVITICKYIHQGL